MSLAVWNLKITGKREQLSSFIWGKGRTSTRSQGCRRLREVELAEELYLSKATQIPDVYSVVARIRWYFKKITPRIANTYGRKHFAADMANTSWINKSILKTNVCSVYIRLCDDARLIHRWTGNLRIDTTSFLGYNTYNRRFCAHIVSYRVEQMKLFPSRLSISRPIH